MFDLEQIHRQSIFLRRKRRIQKQKPDVDDGRW